MGKTFITNMSDSQEPGYDFKKLPKSARAFTCFLDLIIEDTLMNLPIHLLENGTDLWYMQGILAKLLKYTRNAYW
jgi:hypothetical protein